MILCGLGIRRPLSLPNQERNKMNYLHLCPTCHNPYNTPYSFQVYCSPTCRRRNHLIDKNCVSCNTSFWTTNDRFTLCLHCRHLDRQTKQEAQDTKRARYPVVCKICKQTFAGKIAPAHLRCKHNVGCEAYERAFGRYSRYNKDYLALERPQIREANEKRWSRT